MVNHEISECIFEQAYVFSVNVGFEKTSFCILLLRGVLGEIFVHEKQVIVS